MITYTNRTLLEVYNEVMIRLGVHRTAENSDWGTVVKFINNSIYEVLARTLPYKDWAYVNNMNVVNATVLPVEFIKAIRVMLQKDRTSPYMEARYVSPKEFFSLSNWQKQQIWNQGLADSGIYTIWGSIDGNINGQQNLSIYVYPNNLYQTGVAPNGYSYNPDILTGYMEFYRAPAFLVNNADVLPIPYEFEDLVVNYTLLRIFAKTQNAIQLNFIQSLLAPELLRIQEMFNEKRKTEKRELDSFIEPVIPQVAPPPNEGEVQSKL
jgi:hypothetical protein